MYLRWFTSHVGVSNFVAVNPLLEVWVAAHVSSLGDVFLAPRTAVVDGPLQHLHVASSDAALMQVYLLQGQPWLCAHCNTSKWPLAAALVHTCSSQGQPWLLAHFRICRQPPPAALAHVHSFQGASITPGPL